METRIKAIILDFGGVLGMPQDTRRVAIMASMCGLPLVEFLPLYRRDRPALDRGTLSAEEYWRALLTACGRTPSPALVQRLEEEDVLAWTRVNAEVLSWSSELRTAGLKTAILSNMPVAKAAWLRANPDFRWIGEFDPALFSCDYRLVKPEAAFYRLCLDRLEREPGECLFLDDAEENVEAARDLGINAILFRSAAETGVSAARVWGLPARGLGGIRA